MNEKAIADALRALADAVEAESPTPTEEPVYDLEPTWMTVTEAAKYFRISRTTIYRLIASGDWPVSHLPGSTIARFSPDDIARIAEMSQE